QISRLGVPTDGQLDVRVADHPDHPALRVRGRRWRDGVDLVHVEARRGSARSTGRRSAAVLRRAAAGVGTATATTNRLGTAASTAADATGAASARAARRTPAVASSCMGDAITPFEITVPEADLDDLRERLARTRWPDQIPGSAWDYGTDLRYLHDLCDTWRTKFDWRAQEDRFNRWPHYLTEIDGQQIHFIHALSDNPAASPL